MNFTDTELIVIKSALEDRLYKLQIINEKMFRNSKITKEQKEKIGNMIISIK